MQASEVVFGYGWELQSDFRWDVGVYEEICDALWCRLVDMLFTHKNVRVICFDLHYPEDVTVMDPDEVMSAFLLWFEVKLQHCGVSLSHVWTRENTPGGGHFHRLVTILDDSRLRDASLVFRLASSTWRDVLSRDAFCPGQLQNTSLGVLGELMKEGMLINRDHDQFVGMFKRAFTMARSVAETKPGTADSSTTREFGAVDLSPTSMAICECLKHFAFNDEGHYGFLPLMCRHGRARSLVGAVNDLTMRDETLVDSQEAAKDPERRKEFIPIRGLGPLVYRDANSASRPIDILHYETIDLRNHSLLMSLDMYVTQGMADQPMPSPYLRFGGPLPIVRTELAAFVDEDERYMDSSGQRDLVPVVLNYLAQYPWENGTCFVPYQTLNTGHPITVGSEMTGFFLTSGRNLDECEKYSGIFRGFGPRLHVVPVSAAEIAHIRMHGPQKILRLFAETGIGLEFDLRRRSLV